MLSVGEYAKAVVPHGTVGIYPDPHEICNVLGLDGVKCMIEDSKRTPLKCMFVTPSCVPAVPGFEDTGSFVGPEDVTRTIIDGETVAIDGRMVRDPAPYTYPDWARHSVHLKDAVTADTFRIPAPEGRDHVTIRAIEVIPARVGDIERFVTLGVTDGHLESDTTQDVLKTVVLERHHKTGTRGCGFVRGFGIKRGAMASTVAHYAHNLLVVGTNDEDMALAANTLIQCGGGMVAVQDGKVLGLAELPIAGLMNDRSAEEMAHDVAILEDAWQTIGCSMPSPFMTMALIPLACLPDLRLTNRGLVDCRTFSFVPLVTE